MKKLGVELPNPNEAESRSNNRKISYDKMCRKMWIESCKKFNVNVEEVPLLNQKHNMSKEEMIREKYAQLEKQINKNEKIILQQNKIIDEINSKTKEEIKQQIKEKYRNNEELEMLAKKEVYKEKKELHKNDNIFKQLENENKKLREAVNFWHELYYKVLSIFAPLKRFLNKNIENYIDRKIYAENLDIDEINRIADNSKYAEDYQEIIENIETEE